jgi:hypothetical protein
MLTLVESHDGTLDRLRVAAAHLEAAISHVNNVIQAHMPTQGGADHDVAELRLLVMALADIRQALITRRLQNPNSEVA